MPSTPAVLVHRDAGLTAGRSGAARAALCSGLEETDVTDFAKRRSRVWPFLLAVVVGACSSIYDDRPAVDLRGKDERAYRADLSECQDIAARTRDNADIAKTAAVGTVLGAATGAAAGAIGGSAGTGAAAGALAGLVFGGGYEAVTTEKTEKKALRNCLYKRGYTVLD
jgi:hypothetical protein